MVYTKETRPKEGHLIATTFETPMSTTQIPFDFTHLRLEDVDDTFKPVETGVYTLEVNRLDPKRFTVKKETSPHKGEEWLNLKASFTIVEDENNNLRKLWHNFNPRFKRDQIFLKRLMKATGVEQALGDTLEDWAASFAKYDPPVRFQVPVEKKVGEDEVPFNEINFYQAKPVG